MVDEGPVGAGFSKAAIRAASLFRMKDRRPDGVSGEGGFVILPVRRRPQ